MEPLARSSNARWLVPVVLLLVMSTALVAVFAFVGFPLAGTWNALVAAAYAAAITGGLAFVMSHAAGH